MEIRNITEKERDAFNAVVDHPLQTYEWGEFREKTGVTVIRRGFFDPSTSSGGKLVSGFQLSIHKIPRTPWTIGYLPKGDLQSKEMLEELVNIGKGEKCIFIQLEPNVIRSKNQELRIRDENNWKLEIGNWKLQPSAHPLFTRYTFVLDLAKTEEELLADMHPKARYNIKIAAKHDVKVTEDNSDKAFEEYLRLTDETTRRQRFYAHTKRYHQLQWKTFSHDTNPHHLTSHLFTASYDEKVLTTLLFFVFKDMLYYPYGASSNEHRNVMHSNLAMWEGIKFGKKLGLKKFDMWGALGPDPDKNDPWYGFHNFKEKFGPDHVEFIGSYDLIISPLLYQGYKIADKLRWLLLRIKK